MVVCRRRSFRRRCRDIGRVRDRGRYQSWAFLPTLRVHACSSVDGSFPALCSAAGSKPCLSLSRSPGSSPHQSLFTAVIHLSHPSRLRCLALVRAHFLSQASPHGHSVIGMMNQKSPSSGIQKARARQRGWVRRGSFAFVRSFGRAQRLGWAGLRPAMVYGGCCCLASVVVRGGGTDSAGQISSRLVRPNLVGRLRARATDYGSHANRRAVRNARPCYLAGRDG